MNWNLAGRCFVFLWFMIGGICHFVIPAPFVSIVPPYIPFALAVVYISGFFEIAGAIGLWIPALRRLAAYGLILLTICVTPANVFMLMHAELFSAIPYWVLVVRLPLQLLLILIIWRSNQNDSTAA